MTEQPDWFTGLQHNLNAPVMVQDGAVIDWDQCRHRFLIPLLQRLETRNRSPHPATIANLAPVPVARPSDEWSEDDSFVLWWRFTGDSGEPPWVGSPLCDDWVDDYYTHWTPLVCPADPTSPAEVQP